MKNYRQKKIATISAMVLALAALGTMTPVYAACASSHSKVHFADTPAPVKQFVGKYFKNAKVLTTKLDRDRGADEYEITLDNGVKLEIDSKGNWEEISSKKGNLPLNLLPANVRTYLNSNYQGVKVVKMDKDLRGYEIKLANGVEIEFGPQGEFIKIDR